MIRAKHGSNGKSVRVTSREPLHCDRTFRSAAHDSVWAANHLRRQHAQRPCVKRSRTGSQGGGSVQVGNDRKRFVVFSTRPAKSDRTDREPASLPTTNRFWFSLRYKSQRLMLVTPRVLGAHALNNGPEKRRIWVLWKWIRISSR